MVRKLEEERNKITLDFTKPELEYIKENANVTVEELTIFEMLTGKYGKTSTRTKLSIRNAFRIKENYKKMVCSKYNIIDCISWNKCSLAHL